MKEQTEEFPKPEPSRAPSLGHLKSRGQLLKPVVHVGKAGLSDAVLSSVDEALRVHELIKVRFEAMKEQKKTLAVRLAERTGSRLVQRVGNVVVLHRARVAVVAVEVASGT